MSAYNRVADYMSGLPDAANHMDQYVMTFLERKKTERVTRYDGVEVEKAMIGPAERNVIRALSCQLKFTSAMFNTGFRLNVMALTRGQGGFKDRIDKDQEVTLSFQSQVMWGILPAEASVAYSSQESTMHLMDDVKRGNLVSRCNTMASSVNSTLPLLAITEKMSMPMDMRHMFMKMYLYMMDYSLAVTSKMTSRTMMCDIEYDGAPNVSEMGRLSYMMDRKIVVDTDGMTPEELGLLVLSAQAYPSVLYAGENIYNQIDMAKDDLVLVNDKEIKVDTSYLWGSPDRLYHTIWSLACKMDCVPSMVEAFRMMRGMPKMGHDLFRRFDDYQTVVSMVPLSQSLEHALGPVKNAPSVVKYPGYMSTSFGLITDLVYGKMFEASATNVVEQLGGIGKALSSATPDTSRVFNGLLREHGLEHADPTVNLLLKNWHSLSGTVVRWGFGKSLKDYCVKLAGEIQNGLDIDMPQLMMMIPFAHTPDTAWGYSRGWSGSKDILELTKKGRKEESNRLAAAAWVMGQRAVRPKTFRNTFSHEELHLSPAEWKLGAEMPDGCILQDVRMSLVDTVGGRVDEAENTASGLIKTEYAGTKCSLIYDKEGEKWTIDDRRPDYGVMVQQSYHGHPPAERREELRKVRPVTFGGTPQDMKMEADPFAHLKKIDKSIQMRPSPGPRHARVGSDGGVHVAPYILDGEKESGMEARVGKVDWKEGEEITYQEVSVRGDGQCGIHALVEDLRIRGMVDVGDVRKVEELFSEDTFSQSFHATEELAALALKWGFGLSVLDESGTVLQYGQGKLDHNILIKREKNHFSPVVIKPTGRKFKIDKVTKQENSSEEMIREVAKYGHIFGDKRV
ncbi:hypothetical protein [Diplodia seriata chrysovirus 1]|nr:hypothetical protein [Diplodia seriata chrysovirus 1]